MPNWVFVFSTFAYKKRIKMRDLYKYLGGVAIFSIIGGIIIPKVKGNNSSNVVYIETNGKIYHSTPYCEAVPGIDEYDKEYLRDTGDTPGTVEISEREASQNLDQNMCTFCFSPLERKALKEFYQKIKEHKHQ